MDRVEDVLLHQKLLAVAKDPEKRPVYHIRFLEVHLTFDSINNVTIWFVLNSSGKPKYFGSFAMENPNV